MALKRKKTKLFKKPHQLKLASMSINWISSSPKKSGKHRSQAIQTARKKHRRLVSSSSSKRYRAIRKENANI